MWRKEIKKFVAFPGLTPLQPGSDVHPCKQACLTEPPHPSGLPLADGKPQSKIAAVGSTKRLPWSHYDILRLVRGTPVLLISVLPRIGRIGRIYLWILGARQKPNKPLAVDARCLLRAIDAVAARKSSSKLGYFQSATSSPLQGLASIARR